MIFLSFFFLSLLFVSHFFLGLNFNVSTKKKEEKIYRQWNFSFIFFLPFYSFLFPFSNCVRVISLQEIKFSIFMSIFCRCHVTNLLKIYVVFSLVQFFGWQESDISSKPVENKFSNFKKILNFWKLLIFEFFKMLKFEFFENRWNFNF